MRYPIENIQNFNITAGNAFGQRINPTYYHSGNDVNGNAGGNTDCGTPLKAIMPGTITSVVSQVSGYGKHCHLQFQINGKVYWAHYCHLQDVYVRTGQIVKEGDLIGRMGTTGNSTHCHLHFEIKNQPTGVDGIAKTQADLKKWENPWEFIKKNMNVAAPVNPDDVKWNKIMALKDQPGTNTEKLKKADQIIHS